MKALLRLSQGSMHRALIENVIYLFKKLTESENACPPPERSAAYAVKVAAAGEGTADATVGEEEEYVLSVLLRLC
jgi:hypothetical protein